MADLTSSLAPASQPRNSRVPGVRVPFPCMTNDRQYLPGFTARVRTPYGIATVAAVHGPCIWLVMSLAIAERPV